MRDPYTVLGVARGSSDDEIKRAYRRLAKRLHPDLNPGRRGVNEQFREINAAYELLSDPAKRQRYDRGEIDAEGKPRAWGFAGAGAGVGPGGGGGARSGRGFFSDFSIDELMQDFMRGGRGGARAQSARQTVPRTLALTVGFLEAALGGKRTVTLEDGRALEVTIPAGIETGQKLRLRQADGDLLLDVSVAPHPVFTRKERDIHAEAAVPLADAVLGGSIVVPTIHGDVTLKVPKGTNTGAVLRLKGRGIVAGGTGDHYVKLKLVLPEPADPELTALLETWAAAARRRSRGA